MKRLRQIVIGAQCEGFHKVVLTRLAGEHDDVRVRVFRAGSDALADLLPS